MHIISSVISFFCYFIVISSQHLSFVHFFTEEAPFDLWEFDIARFSRHYSNRSYLKARAIEVLSRHYTIPWTNFEMKSGRKIKMTPFHTRLDDAGASWGCVNGWERPNWYRRSPNGVFIKVFVGGRG